jgi:uncharacterized protein (TIGR02598 family)
MNTPFAVSRLRRPRGKRGFSLVEVTIALGVAAFALVAIFGMLPTGLNLFRSSMDTSIKSQIAQQITSEFNQTDFSKLLDGSATPPESFRYFAEDGQELDTQADSIYTAKVNVKINPDMPRDGGTTDGLQKNPTLVRVQIMVARDPGHRTELFTVGSDGKLKPEVTSFSTFVARNESILQ